MRSKETSFIIVTTILKKSEVKKLPKGHPLRINAVEFNAHMRSLNFTAYNMTCSFVKTASTIMSNIEVRALSKSILQKNSICGIACSRKLMT
jgi:hypothetical protein